MFDHYIIQVIHILHNVRKQAEHFFVFSYKSDRFKYSLNISSLLPLFYHFIEVYSMGNQVCCDDSRVEQNPGEKIQAEVISKNFQKHLEEKHQPVQNVDPAEIKQPEQKVNKPHVVVPELTPAVRDVLSKHKFFESQFANTKCQLRQFENDLYDGEINETSQKPDGIGRMYKSDGSLYIGYFRKGKAEGRGVLIFANGSFYQGDFSDNKANCYQGYYESAQCRYTGGFKDNAFSGQGKEEGSNYTFEGTFNNGKRVNGTLKWTDETGFVFFYTGSFNEAEKFHGQGTLAEKKGVYEGSFVNGVKEGQGYYKGVNGVKYRGSYKNGIKEGYGIIYNGDDTVAYKGELKNGLPHGKGSAYVENQIIEAEWIEGINQTILKEVAQE